MTKWPTTALRGKIHVKHGFPFKGEHFQSSGTYVVLTPGNFHEQGGFKRNAEKDKCYCEPFPKEYLLNKGDIVVAMTEQAEGLLGSTALIPESGKFLHNQRLGLITAQTGEVLPEFIYHLFKTFPVRDQIRRTSSGSKVKHTSPERIYDVHVPLPPVKEQAAIAEVLTTLDAKIALNHRINSELEGMAKLLYDYWFVQYDFPLSAAQAAALGKPRLAGKPYRTSGGLMVYHDPLKREIPKGWEVGNLSELCLLNHRTWPNKDHPDQVTYLDLANAKNGEILSVQNFNWDEAPSRARRILTPGDTIFGTVRPGNRSFALVPKSKEILTGSTGFAVLTPKSAIYREFNYLSLTSESNINRLTTVASGAAYPAVNPEVVAAQTIALPAVDLIQHFHQTTVSFFDLIERHRAQNQEFTTLRDWLLPMLMNGQVRVG
jgi:type I restriction enzyme S subunit